MSDIKQARKLIRQALALMTREPPIKRSKPKRVVITTKVRARVKNLASMGKSNHQIAEIVGLANGGRVSEILNGKR
jgi:hypothetical protein